MAWHTAFGIELGNDALLSPSHLMLGLGLFLIVSGPFLARDLPLVVKPAFQSETVAKDPQAAKSLYVADLRTQSDKPASGRLIHTRRGMGYVLAAEEPPGADQV